MSKDISKILAGWDHEPDELQVRLVAGDNGREKIQMRLDLGVLQMEMEGRPDGRRSGEFDSVLDRMEHEAAAAQTVGEEFALDAEDCAELRREGVQYYHRYLALFQLDRYDLVARDTERNLRLLTFVREHAARRSDRLLFDQYRPYVTMMRARALSLQAIERDDYGEALREIDEGIAGIREFLREYEQDEERVECQELAFLRQWRRDVEQRRPSDPMSRLDEQLRRAVSNEEYEEAARLRDQIQRMGRPDSGNALSPRSG